MSTKIQGLARFKIHEGKLEEFKRLANNCMQLASEKDTGTIRYELFFNADESECIVYEEYIDSAALTQHFNNMGDNAPAMFAITDMQGEVWGEPSPELRKDLQAYGVRIFKPYLRLKK